MAFDPPKAVTGEALEEWNRLLDYMEEQGYDVEENVQPYASYCINVQIRDECFEDIKARGLMVFSRREGCEIRNPSTMTMNSANATILEISKRFGFSPLDKRSLAAQKEEEPDDQPSYLKAIKRK